jgi:hypothetical protein
MAGVHGPDELERLWPADLAQGDPVRGETQRLPQQYGKVGVQRRVEVDDIVAPHGGLGRVLDDDQALADGDLGEEST